jgi:hypothetical protein
MSSPSRSLILSLILVATITSFVSFHLYGFKETFANGGPVTNSNLSSFASPTTNTTFGSTSNSTFATSQQTTGPTTFASPNTNPTLENTSTTSNSISTSSEPQQATEASVPPQGPPANLAARGTINSLVAVPQTKWIAAGNWSMDINKGNLTGFLTNMSFFDERGTATHTHEFLNFRPDADYKIIAQLPNSSLLVRGVMDVGTNHKVVWKSVPTIIDVKGGKTISISVNDKATNSHFASQPILGVVSNLASGLKVQITPAKSTVSSGDDQPINVTVSDSTSNAPLAGIKISGVMIDASPGAKVLIKDTNSTEPIATSKIEGKKFSGVTDENGQYSVTEPISTGKKVGTYTIVVTASGKGYNPISEIETFKVEK